MVVLEAWLECLTSARSCRRSANPSGAHAPDRARDPPRICPSQPLPPAPELATLCAAQDLCVPQSLPADLPDSLDLVHLHVRDSFKQRDLVRYARYLAADVTFVDPNGRVQDREELLRSLRRQFARLVSFDSHFDRESLVVDAGDAVETGTQTAAIALRIFLLLEVRWRITRHGRYTWRRDPVSGWALRHVLLDRNQFRRESIGLAGRAPSGKLTDQVNDRTER